MTLILDAGALIAIDRGSRDIAVVLKRERLSGRVPKTHGAIIGQAWRGDARQVLLARLISSLEVAPLDEQLGRRAGALLARARTNDVVDAALVLLASDGDEIFTSDVRDIQVLCEAAGLSVDIIRA